METWADLKRHIAKLQKRVTFLEGKLDNLCMQPFMESLVAHIQAKGFDVYMRSRGLDCYGIFTDGARIGYFQHVDGRTSLATLHRANVSTGTGFVVKCGSLPTCKELESALSGPAWISATARPTVRKYASVEEVNAANALVSPYTLVPTIKEQERSHVLH